MATIEVKPESYWVKRAKARDNFFRSTANKRFSFIRKQYKTAYENMSETIDKFYGRYGTPDGQTVIVTQNDAFAIMSRQETRAFQRKAEKIREKVIITDDDAFKIRLGKYSSNKRQVRKNAMDLDHEYDLHKVFNAQQLTLDDMLPVVYKDGYILTQFDIARGIGFSRNILGELGERRIKKLIEEPWSGQDFSSRIWKNKEKLTSTVKELTTRGMVQGQHVREMANELSKRMGVSKKNALRLMISETTHASETASLEASRDAGFEKMEVVSTPSDKYHFTRSDINGKVFKIGSSQQAFYTPPIEYPLCMCVLVPLIDNKTIEIFKAPRKYDSFADWKKANNKKTSLV